MKPEVIAPLTKTITQMQYKYNLKERTFNPMTITDSTGAHTQLALTSDFPKKNEFDAYLVDSVLLQKNIIVTITADPAAAEHKFLYGGELISGFSFRTTAENVDIRIYLSPETESLTSKEFELSRNYISALLVANEYEKWQKDQSIIPKYDDLKIFASDLAIAANGEQKFPVQIKTK